MPLFDVYNQPKKRTFVRSKNIKNGYMNGHPTFNDSGQILMFHLDFPEIRGPISLTTRYILGEIGRVRSL